MKVKWAELSDKEKIRLVIKALGWHCFETYEDQHWHHWHVMSEEMERPYPSAFWNDLPERWQVFYNGQDDSKPFDPFHSMDDAWQIVASYDEIVLSRHVPEKYYCVLWRDTQVFKMIGATAQEAICLAGLQAVGVEVEV